MIDLMLLAEMRKIHLANKRDVAEYGGLLHVFITHFLTNQRGPKQIGKWTIKEASDFIGISEATFKRECTKFRSLEENDLNQAIDTKVKELLCDLDHQISLLYNNNSINLNLDKLNINNNIGESSSKFRSQNESDNWESNKKNRSKFRSQEKQALIEYFYSTASQQFNCELKCGAPRKEATVIENLLERTGTEDAAKNIINFAIRTKAIMNVTQITDKVIDEANEHFMWKVKLNEDTPVVRILKAYIGDSEAEILATKDRRTNYLKVEEALNNCKEADAIEYVKELAKTGKPLNFITADNVNNFVKSKKPQNGLKENPCFYNQSQNEGVTKEFVEAFLKNKFGNDYQQKEDYHKFAASVLTTKRNKEKYNQLNDDLKNLVDGMVKYGYC